MSEAKGLVNLVYKPIELLTGNPHNLKKHDIGGIAESIKRYGFRDGVLTDKNEIVAGHGRVEALLLLKKTGSKPPEGIQVVDSKWLVPCLELPPFKSEKEKRAYLLDHNLLTMLGGDFSLSDLMRGFDVGIVEELEDLASSNDLPVGIDADALDSLLSTGGSNDPDDLDDDPTEPEDGERYALNIVLGFEDFQRWKAFKQRVGLSRDQAAFLEMMDEVGQA